MPPPRGQQPSGRSTRLRVRARRGGRSRGCPGGAAKRSEAQRSRRTAGRSARPYERGPGPPPASPAALRWGGRRTAASALPSRLFRAPFPAARFWESRGTAPAPPQLFTELSGENPFAVPRAKRDAGRSAEGGSRPQTAPPSDATRRYRGRRAFRTEIPGRPGAGRDSAEPNAAGHGRPPQRLNAVPSNWARLLVSNPDSPRGLGQSPLGAELLAITVTYQNAKMCALPPPARRAH